MTDRDAKFFIAGVFLVVAILVLGTFTGVVLFDLTAGTN